MIWRSSRLRAAGLVPVAPDWIAADRWIVLTGTMIGPSGPDSCRRIWIMSRVPAEVGVVLLLFIVGLELSISGLKSTPLKVYLAAIAQVTGTTALVFGIMISLGMPFELSLVAGFVVTVSSSALVLKGIADKGELNTPMGRMVVTICVVQDLAIVPMMMIVSILASGNLTTYEIGVRAVLVAGWVLSLYLLARWILPQFLRWLVRAQLSEALFLFAILLMLVVGAISSIAGLSI
ncbi:MAG: cation:proton antiporter, partial [bacterium]|nr:cation:proton antiporter [bacterium]